MTKRHDTLIPLTHDHHHALAQARALIVAADKDAPERARVADSFVRFFRQDALVHFREEEELLFPELLQHVDDVPAQLARVLIEHVRMHGMVARLQEVLTTGAPDGGQLKALGETLRGHVRVEENDLFPLIERVVPEAELASLVLPSRDRGPNTKKEGNE